MIFKQFYLACLAQASYLIGDAGEAVVVDPQRDVDQYLEEAKRHGLTIKHIIETHLHADFVSGHIELAKRTGAKIYLGAKAGAEFPHVPVHEGDEIKLGKVLLRFLETPGHTPESISVLVGEAGKMNTPQKILTGDTLFIGDVGRPDLVGLKGYTPEKMAGMLYDSLWQKILPLPDSVEVYPAHGAGSACGRNISKDAFSTLGEQRSKNYALKKMSREDFIKLATTDLSAAPAYFFHDAEANRKGALALNELPEPRALSVEQVMQEVEAGALLLDVREYRNFGNGHVPSSLNIGLGGMFAPWSGTLVGPQQKVILIAQEDEQVKEANMRLARVGMENVLGYLAKGLRAWDEKGLKVATLPQWPVDELHAQISEDQDLQILDVRRPGEYAAGHIQKAVSIPLQELEKNIGKLDVKRPVAVICGSGYRSSVAASLLLRNHFAKLYNVIGGMSAWTTAGYETRTS